MVIGVGQLVRGGFTVLVYFYVCLFSIGNKIHSFLIGLEFLEFLTFAFPTIFW